jgi:hypothetical protein
VRRTGESVRKGEDGMNVKHVGAYTLVVTVLGASIVRAEDPPAVPGENVVQPVQYGSPATTAAPPPALADAGPPPVPQVSRWIAGPACDCCGPFGGQTLGYEIYLRNGISLPFGSGPLAKDLDAGWVIEGGARLLIFSPSKLAAWTVDLGIVNINNRARGDHPADLFDIVVPNPNFIPQLGPSVGNPATILLHGATVRFDHYNRTFASAAFGREWYLWDPANSCGLMWRAGIDLGFRYGTSKLDLQNLPPHEPHRTKVIGAPVVSVHTDIEWPCGACIYQAGFRAEWSYTFSEILQDQNDANVSEGLLMLNLGVRF